MKTKYIKVSVSERLPEKEGWYFIIHHNPIRSKAKYIPEYKRFYGYSDIDFWLEEVPDMEEEMREMLERAFEFTSSGCEVPEYLTHEIEELLTKLK